MTAMTEFTADPELASEMEMFRQKQAMADALAKRGQTPLTVSSGLISPFQVAGQMATAYQGKTAREAANKELSGIAERYNTRLAAGVQDYMKRRSGTPEQSFPVVDDPAAGQYAPPSTNAAVPPDPKGAMIAALTSRNPALRALGGMDHAAEQKRLEGRVLGADASWVRPPEAGGTVTNRKPSEHAIPDGWEKFVPPGGKIEGKGIVRMTGADGQPDLYMPEFERGEFRGWKKLDNSPKAPTVHVNNPPPVTVTTVAHPNKPGETLQVDARTYKGGAEGSPGVIGPGAKLTQVGTAGLKLEAEKPMAASRLAAVVQNINRLDAALTTLQNHKGLSGITGTVYGRTPAITNAATGALGHYESITSQIFQASLQAMREASKTGGAVGNVSDKEGDKFEKTLGALNRSMGTAEFKTEITKVQAQLKLSKERIQKAFDEQYGQTQNFVPPKAAGGAAGAPPPPDGFTPLN